MSVNTSKNFTPRLLGARERGAAIVCSVAPYEGYAMDYAPRRRNDPSPWVLAGVQDSFRYSGRECHETWPNGKPQRKLGQTQQHCLEAMTRHGGSWYSGGGWMWGNRSQTLTVMRALAKRGLVMQTSEERFRERFELTEAGWSASGKAAFAFGSTR